MLHCKTYCNFIFIVYHFFNESTKEAICEIKNTQNFIGHSGLCNSFTGHQKALCWEEMSHAYLFISDYDAEFAFGACSKTPTRETQIECTSHALASIISQNQNIPARTKDVCFLQTAMDDFMGYAMPLWHSWQCSTPMIR